MEQANKNVGAAERLVLNGGHDERVTYLHDRAMLYFPKWRKGSHLDFTRLLPESTEQGAEKIKAIREWRTMATLRPGGRWQAARRPGNSNEERSSRFPSSTVHSSGQGRQISSCQACSAFGVFGLFSLFCSSSHWVCLVCFVCLATLRVRGDHLLPCPMALASSMALARSTALASSARRPLQGRRPFQALGEHLP